MLVAYRLAGLSALETYYAGVRVSAQCRIARCIGRPFFVAIRTLNSREGQRALKSGPAHRALDRHGQ
jgi:hypothetical protein